MLRDKQKHISSIASTLLIITFLVSLSIQAELSTLAKNDPYPMFKTIDPHDFLQMSEKLQYREADWAHDKRDRFGIYISPFAQNADRGKTIRGERYLPVPVASPPNGALPTGPQSDNTSVIVPLGDLEGRSSMMALLMGAFPEGVTTYPGGATGYLQQAFNNFFPATTPATFTPGNFNNADYIDPEQLFGYFSFPLKYRKRGLRIEFDMHITKDFGLYVQTSISNIRQTVENQQNLTNESEDTQLPAMLTPPPTTPAISTNQVNNLLMDQLNNIAPQMGLDISNFNRTSCEEIRVNFFWRHAFEFNDDMDIDWPQFLLIPFIEAGISFSPGAAEKECKQWAVPFGNNDHASIGFSAGLNLDFLETIEIGGETGYTHFFKRHVDNFRVPTSQFQTTLFPFATSVSMQPGGNWYFGAKISAFHFVGHLSAYFEWFMLDHSKDSICLQKQDPAFLPQVLEERSSFKVKFGNFGLNYDVSPNIGLGFLWQMPFSQRNAYRSSTLMAGLNANF